MPPPLTGSPSACQGDSAETGIRSGASSLSSQRCQNTDVLETVRQVRAPPGAGQRSFILWVLCICGKCQKSIKWSWRWKARVSEKILLVFARTHAHTLWKCQSDAKYRHQTLTEMSAKGIWRCESQRRFLIDNLPENLFFFLFHYFLLFKAAPRHLIEAIPFRKQIPETFFIYLYIYLFYLCHFSISMTQ